MIRTESVTEIPLRFCSSHLSRDTKSWFQDYHSMGAVYECIRSL
jgi:hypothetical protein